jgi:DNA-binding PadR family transcriptional regulator
MALRSDPPLHPEIFEILLALHAGPVHGFGIVQAVEEHTEGRLLLAPSLLYRRLQKLEDQGLVAEAGEEPGERGVPRKLYELTPAGRELVRDEARRLLALSKEGRIRRLAVGGDPS